MDCYRKIHMLLAFPYDGKQAGDFLGDAIRNITGTANVAAQEDAGGSGVMDLVVENASVLYTGSYDTGSKRQVNLSFNASRRVPTAYENRVASLSEVRYIFY